MLFKKKQFLRNVFSKANEDYTNFKNTIDQLKTDIKNKSITSDIVVLLGSTTSGTGV